jgi:hypothetical protein
MKKRAMIVIILVTAVTGCSALKKKESDFFSSKEIKILEATTSAIGYDYGYDSEPDLDYVFSYTYGEKGVKNKPAKLKGALDKFEKRSLIRFYEKVYILKFKTIKVRGKYREKKEWKEYTHVDKYLLPTLEKYVQMLEGQVLVKAPDYRSRIASRKKEIEAVFAR